MKIGIRDKKSTIRKGERGLSANANFRYQIRESRIRDIEGFRNRSFAFLVNKEQESHSPVAEGKIGISTYPASWRPWYIISAVNKFTSALSIFDVIHKQFAGAPLTDFTYS